MKQRVVAAFAAFGLVAVMSGLGAIPAMADEPAEPTTSAVEETTTPTEEPAPVEEPAPPAEEPAPPAEEPAPTEELPPADEPVNNEPDTPAGTDPPADEPQQFASAQSFGTLAALIGVEGEMLPWSSETNQASYWKNWLGSAHDPVCYSDMSSSHGTVTDGGKTVTLKPYGADWPGDHWELLVIKGGNLWNNVIVHPQAGVAYASPLNNGGQQAGVSHWIVCKGTTPDVTPTEASASVTTTPGTCEAAGTVIPLTAVNAVFGDPEYANGQYTIVATATNGAKFPAGDGVSPDGTTRTFTGPVPPQNTELCTGEITYCHAHPADTAANGWELMENKPIQSVNGHKQHAADIIPPNPIIPAGLNWNGSFVVNGVQLSAQEILRLGCDFSVKVPEKPKTTNEYCSEGEAQDGSITVFFGDLGDTITYTITGNGIDPIVIESGDPTTVYLPAGTYKVEAEGVPPYKVEGKSSWDVKIKAADCTEVTICHWDKYKPWLLWTEVTVTETQALQHAKNDSKDIIPAFGEFGGKNLDAYFFEFWTGEQILLNGCDKPYFETDICHWDKKDQKWYPLTVGPIELGVHILLDKKDIIPPVGDYSGKNLTTDFDGLTGQQIYDHDCTKKVWVPEPEWGGEYCYGGETVDGWIGVKYTADMIGKLQYRITSTDGFDYVVPAVLGWSYLDVPAGDYTVTAEPIDGWVPKGNSPYELTIGSATNCQCYVPEVVDEKVALFAVLAEDIAPVCAEAAVSVTPPTCEAAGELVLGDVYLATWGEPVIADGEYAVVATADPGYRFAPGEGVSEDGFTKEFTGQLPGKLTACGSSLPVTGGSGTDLLWVALLATVLGIGAVVTVSRRTAE